MLNDLPLFVSSIFILTAFVTVFLFYKASGNSKPVLLILGIWLLIQGMVGFSGFYTVTDTLPPRFSLLIGPPLILIILLFLTEKGRHFIDALDLKKLTYLHTVRVPVELVLLWLYQSGYVPELMTFEGRNFDVLSGITAPFIAYMGFSRKKLGKRTILIWNFICLALLLNIVINAILAAPFPFQKIAFDQPNIGVLYFPFIWLPACIVPLVLLSHLTAIRQLLKR